MAKADVISSCLVGMEKYKSLPVPVDNSRIYQTPWDLQFLEFRPCRRVILFNKPSEEDVHDFEKIVIQHLKTSLSRTLDFFPPLAGRLGTVQNPEKTTTSYFIDCNNAGAEFVHAVARNVSVSNIFEPSSNIVMSSFSPLKGYLNYHGVSKPLLGVQVTELADGFFISLAANHSVVDGSSFWHFINSWSEISRGLDTISKNPSFERSFHCNVTNANCLIPLPPFPSCSNVVTPTTSSVQRIFHFSKENLGKLKSKANIEAGTEKISTLQAVSAHLWKSVVRQQKNTCNLNDQDVCCFVMMVDARGRIPLPDGYFGSAVYSGGAECSVHELVNNGIGYVALKLNAFVNQQTKEAAIKFVQDWVKCPRTISRKTNTSTLLMTSSPRYDVYGNDFGWGKPIATKGGYPLDGKITASPASGGGGINLEVCLAPLTLQAMEDDAEFMEAVTI